MFRPSYISVAGITTTSYNRDIANGTNDGERLRLLGTMVVLNLGATRFPISESYMVCL
jgi:hypothetical protein